MATSLPYNLQEGTIAHAGKVMANFRALLGILNNLIVEGVGTGDLATILNLISQAMVKADETGNAGEIRFADGETVEQKFAAGTLNASLLDSEGLFYFFVNQDDGHLYVTASEGMEADNFEIDEETGHLLFNLNDPDESNVVHTYDLGLVKGADGEPGEDGMLASTYDPNNVGKDLNTYTGFFLCDAQSWVDGVYVISDTDRISGAALADHITASSGHVWIGPSSSATDDGVTAWANGMIRMTGQGSGTITIKALGDTPSEDIELQITMFV